MSNHSPTAIPKIYTAPKKLFSCHRSNSQYLFESELTVKVIQGMNKVCPLVIDTEFWQPEWNDYLSDKENINVLYKNQFKQIYMGKDYWKHGRFGLTTQIKGIHEDKGMILAHPDLKIIAMGLGEKIRHPIASSGFHPVDYLQDLGIPARLKHVGKILKTYRGEKLPAFEFVLYAHFALAEWGMIADGEFKIDMVDALLRSYGNHIEMRKRARTVYESKYMCFDSIDMPWVLFIDEMPFRVKICVIDTCGIHGVATYKYFCQASNTPVLFKDAMDDYKEKMHIGYFEKPQDFDNYSLGDLEVYKALANNAHLFKEIWKSLQIEEYYRVPSLTIGSTVTHIFEAKIYKLFNISPEDKETQKNLLDKLCYKTSAEYLKQFTHSTLSLNAKVNGGRCRNNRPNLVKLEGVLVDIDYDGCYGEGQRNQIYPFGNPIQESFKHPSKINQYPSLREWLKARKWGTAKNELVPGLWQARVCTKEIWKDSLASFSTLETSQDVIESWFNFKISDISKMKTDTDKHAGLNDEYLEVKSGEVKIFNHQIINGLIQHDFIQWLENVASPKQKNELLDNLYVHTSIYYPAYDRVNSPEELLERIANHKGKNIVKSGRRRNGSYVCERNEECTAWYGVNLGEFIIDDLLAWRKIYPKKNNDGTKNAMNVLYKLCTNTLYGDMVTPFFKISNVVVGNNITARARFACWYAEKGFYGCQSITDGTAFNLNTIVYPLKNRRITAQSVVNLHRVDNPAAKRQLKLSSLGNYKNIELGWKKVTEEGKDKNYPVLALINENETLRLEPQFIKEYWTNPAHDWLNKAALEHLQNIFQHVDILHKETTKLKSYKGEDGKPVKEFSDKKGQFQFEAKCFYQKGFFHGSANYFLQGEGGNNLAMRSYENKKTHQTPVIDEEMNIAFTTAYNEKLTPAQVFINALSNPHSIQRGKVFIKNVILKVNEGRKNKDRWRVVGRIAGDTIQKSGLLREFSPSQFTFLHLEQYNSISREINFNKRHYTQTYEGYFINNDTTLDFQAMVSEIDLAIGEGCLSLNQKFDRSRNRHRDDTINHPQSETLEKVRNILLRPEAIDELEDDWFSDVKNLQIVSDQSGILYTVDGDYDPTESMDIEDESLLDDIDFGI